MKTTYLTLLFSIILPFVHASSHKYKGGDEYTRRKLDSDEIEMSSGLLRRSILRTVKIVNTVARSVGTGFYLYETPDSYVFLTNYHVLGNSTECQNAKLLMLDSNFDKKRLRCDKVLEIGDYSTGSDHFIFSMSKGKRTEFLAELDQITHFENDAHVGDELSIVGFGGAKTNDRRFDIGVSEDQDCVLLDIGKDVSFNNLLMPSILFTACDIRSGDSGSAVFNKRTGSLVGLLFATSKHKDGVTRAEIKDNLGRYYQRFHTHSSYAIDIESINLEKYRY